MNKILMLFVLSSLLLISTAFTDPNHMPKIETSKEFNKLKVLLGRWEGKSEKEKEGMPKEYLVEYKLTSNGSAILETSFPGGPNEMVSVYYDEKGRLSMKHYCALGNQPFMQLAGSGDNSISLDFAEDNSIDPQKEPHMHALNIVFEDSDNIVQNWTSYDGKGGKETHTMKLARVK
ncbi:MAG: hypothetical protein GWO07_04605 [Candidatus Dadabacteria bacterium]|nr:hypothetical protein [Candidatus Dadabacteria bacterium]NIS08042.1 hypothetical protein [Candidatus Dadabacteria bacterium]NIV40865.1 hypothetical protein [Candidatus Dadabacteria bacterium]NIY21620.1 hypothetical protein [Candidatus Dadabacteria bacterium]